MRKLGKFDSLVESVLNDVKPSAEDDGVMHWFSGSGKLNLDLTMDQARCGSHTGDCYADIRKLRQEPGIKEQLDKMDKSVVKAELREYGAWDDEELANDDKNLDRILWLACGDIVDNPEDYR